uniref:DDE Tnp4 domain-containing protein n=1 Tax=Strongyloides venezuelensis TaxID=75913 RepID=A0A0K0G5R1_STRVS
MAKKNSRRPEYPRSSKLTTEEKVEGNEETSGPLTAAETNYRFFESVNTVYFDVLKPEYISLRIFNEWISLKLDTLIFGNAEVDHSGYNNSNISVYSDGSHNFPKTIKHIHLVCMTKKLIEWTCIKEV